MGAEAENILILKQADNFYCVVIEHEGKSTGFGSCLNRDEALAVVAAKLMGGRLPAYYRTLEGVACEAMGRVSDTASQGHLLDPYRNRVGEWLPYGFLDDDNEPGSVALCLSDGNDEHLCIRVYGLNGHLLSKRVPRKAWDGAKAAWIKDGGERL